jgi:hypothetical protein
MQWLEIEKAEVKEEWSKGSEVTLTDADVRIAEKDLKDDDCEIETSNSRLISLRTYIAC